MDTEKVVISGFAGTKPVSQPKVNVCMRDRPRKENFVLSYSDLKKYFLLRHGPDPIPQLHPDRLIKRYDQEYRKYIEQVYEQVQTRSI
jgi:hypothetical protein